ncbi:retrovirus-related pol polyprotein from transposon TNT 1-94 [Tanacetum coccineum]
MDILYRLDDESPKIVTSRNVVFNESVMYKDTLKNYGVGTDKSVEELQVEVKLQRLNNHTPEEDQTEQEDGDDEDAGDQETNQTPDLTDYQLAQDRKRRTRTNPLRFRDEEKAGKLQMVVQDKEGLKIRFVKCLGTRKSLVARGLHTRADDMLIACKSKAEIGSTKSLLKKEFDMKELGEAKKILGMEIVRD